MRGSDSLTLEECTLLIGAVGTASGALAIRDLTMLEVLAGTGLRVSELVSLRVSQLMEYGQVKDILHLDRKHTKRGRGGKLPVSNRLKGVISAYVRWLRGWYEGDWMFPGYNGRHLSTRAVQLRLKEIRLAADVRKKITPHSLRKFYVQRLLDSKLDVRTVMELSRHANLESLHAYLVVNEAAAAAAVEGIL